MPAKIAATHSSTETRPAATVTSLTVNANTVPADDANQLPTNFVNEEKIENSNRILIEMWSSTEQRPSATLTSFAVNANAMPANGTQITNFFQNDHHIDNSIQFK